MTYRRVLVVTGRPTELTVRQEGPLTGSRVIVTATPSLRTLSERELVASVVDKLLGLRIDLTEWYRLAEGHQRLRPLAARFRGVKPPRFPTVFETLVNAFACQQLSLVVGLELLNRLGALCNVRYGTSERARYAFPAPRDVARIAPASYQAIGLSRQKIRALLTLARRIAAPSGGWMAIWPERQDPRQVRRSAGCAHRAAGGSRIPEHQTEGQISIQIVGGHIQVRASRVPVLAIAAHIPSLELGSGYFQETHPERLFTDCSHFCEVISHPGQVPRVLEIAIQTAVAQSGVAVIVLPGDVALLQAEQNAPRVQVSYERPAVCAAETDVAAAARLLNDTAKVTILGGAGCRGAHAELVATADVLAAPVVHAMRGKEFIEYDDPFDVGMTGLLGFASGYLAMKDCELTTARRPRVGRRAGEHTATRHATIVENGAGWWVRTVHGEGCPERPRRRTR